GAPKILVVSPDDDEAGPLLAALEGADRKVEVVLPGEMPATLVGLAEYEAVILVNVRARDLPAGAMDALPAYVRDLGRGLAMVGGDHSFGAGGYRHTPVEKALPVDMEVRDREARPDIALAFVIDKSGSMAGCTTCGSGGGMGFGSGGALGKVDLAKEAVVEAADLLSDRDAAALVAFDGDSHTMWALQRHNDPDGFASAVAGITADGGTNIYSGLEAGVAELEGAAPPLKHIILLTDGWSDATGYDRVLERMADAHITLSVVAVGEDSAPYLEDLAAAGNGRFYPAVDPADVPQIFVEETITTLGMFVIEERFQPAPASPSEILRGLAADTLPPLGGYNGTTPKQSARVALVSHRDDPVLAQWQYGLGRAVAWTSDLKRQWATDWVPWSDFPSFAVQLVDWTVPAPDAKGLTTGVQAEGGKALITLQAADEGGRTLNALDVEAVMAADDERRTTVPLEQSAPGEYSGVAELPAEGAYLVRIVARSGGNIVGTQTAGFVVPYSPEFATVASEPTDPRAYRLAELTGGRIITDPAAAFAPVEGIRQARDVWPWLLLVAVVLLPVDVGVRRLKFKRADFAAARAWLAAIPGRLHGRGEALPEP
ncbi:MAG: VWA domain-containing protein, partial [Anaerolineae bacterium]